MLFADQDTQVGAAGDLTAEFPVVIVFSGTQFHHTGSYDDAAPRKHFKHIQSSPGSSGVAVVGIVYHGHAAAVWDQLQTMLHGNKHGNAPLYL